MSIRHKSVLPLIVSLSVTLAMLVAPTEAKAAESIPALQWPAATIGRLDSAPVTSTNGDISVPCATADGGSDLTTYNAFGQVVRQISQTSVIDGITNCLTTPVAAKNGDIYGIPWGKNSSGSYMRGPNLLAYTGNTLKWKYPLSCGYGQGASYAVGANGNIYSTTQLSDGIHLIGLTPEVATGQAAPTKVLDIKVPGDCNMTLLAYKDGVVLRGQSSGNARYFSYSGKSLGQATIGSIWDEKLNAEGQLFVPAYVTGGGFQSVNVSRYDPSSGTVKWTTQVSQPGADTNGISLFPTPGGGLVALITEQDMVSDGMPATPKTWHKALVTINATGQKVRSIILPGTFSDGTTAATFSGTYLVAETGSKVAIVREMSVNTGLSYPATMPGISVQTYDPMNNTWPYQQTILGDPNKPGGPYGYALEADASQAIHPANGALYVRARCSGNCPASNRKLFALAVNGVGVDYPRGDVLTADTPAQPTPLNYVSLGDSYSSGQGAGEYSPNTTITSNMCHQSSFAYGRSLDRDPQSPLSLAAFRACGGAVTSDITTTKTYPGVSEPQGTALTSTTQIVSITIGGNDIGFTNVIETCANPTKDCNGAFDNATSLLGSVFDNKLQTVYLHLLQKAPNAQIYVLGYPPILASGSSGCLIGNNGGSLPFYGPDRITKGVALLNGLNSAIQANINTIRSLGSSYQRLRYVDVTTTSSPFMGHDICSSVPYVNGLILSPGDTSESFHPNIPGQGSYASQFASRLGT